MYLAKEGVAPTLTPLLGWSARCKTERSRKLRICKCKHLVRKEDMNITSRLINLVLIQRTGFFFREVNVQATTIIFF